jgi:hypothetical protein
MHTDRVALLQNPRLDESGSSQRAKSNVPKAVLVSPGGLTSQGDSIVSNSNHKQTTSKVDLAGDVPFRAIRESTDLKPISVPVKLGTRPPSKVDAQTDCGALLNAINYEWYILHQSDLGALEVPDFHFHLADGSCVLNKGSITLRVEVLHDDGNIVMDTRFQVMPTRDDWTVLLGRPWLRDNKVKVDYGEEVLSIVRDNNTTAAWGADAGSIEYTGDRSAARAIRMIGSDETSAPEWSVQPGIMAEDVETLRGVKVLRKITIGADLTRDQKGQVEEMIL